MGNVSKNLSCHEILHPDVAGRNWRIFFDQQIIDVFQYLRDKFGAITINNWKTGGSYKNSGYRPPSSTVGAKYSQHRFGRALDLKFKDTTPEAVYDWIMDNQEEMYKVGLRRVENAHKTKTWLHIDVMNHGQENIIQSFNP